MSAPITRSFQTFTTMALVASALAMLDGCSKAADESAAAAPNASAQAQAAQLAILAAQAAQNQKQPGTMQEDGAAAPSAPMAMGGAAAPSAPMAMGGGAVPGAPMASGQPAADSPPMNMGAPAAGAPTGMARLFGQPPMPSGASAAGGLPQAIGAPHIYHLGANTFFLDQASAIGLTTEQQKKLTALKESAATAYATTQRKIDQGEQDLWVLSSSEAPQIAKIETKIGETARLTGQQRMDFIRTVGVAVAVLSDAQRKAVASQGGAMPPSTMPPAASASGMPMGGGAPPPAGMGMGDKKMPPGMPPPGMGMSKMADAGPSGGMGHM